MSKKPFVHAFLATLYIAAVACLLFYGPKLVDLPKEDNVLMPIAMISLFTFSAAVMGYLFLSAPIQLYLDGDKKGAVNFFLKTLATFGIVTLIVFIAMFLGVLA